MIERFMENRKLRKIHRLMEKERQHLLDGSLTGLLPLVEEREKLIAQLAADRRFTIDDIKGIQGLAQLNQRLFKASLDGIAAAMKGSRSASPTPAATYTKAGMRIEPERAPSSDRKV